MRKHCNLQSLIFSHPGARQYYNALPEDVRNMVNARGESICTLGSLVDYSEKFSGAGLY
jgi:hypothetical protein